MSNEYFIDYSSLITSSLFQPLKLHQQRPPRVLHGLFHHRVAEPAGGEAKDHARQGAEEGGAFAQGEPTEQSKIAERRLAEELAKAV